ncbi:hypothetical protein DWW36_07125 [Erysipelotrichaceae bacterium AF15-26LB]|nr:hypothetical protein DWW36_07125 [Erysipelotrichaceae bacterium AF15-26LB]RJV90464.1 hypothetical protein DWX45_08955 [Erysipelotrichaceae bacterium AF19-24AC]
MLLYCQYASLYDKQAFSYIWESLCSYRGFMICLRMQICYTHRPLLCKIADYPCSFLHIFPIYYIFHSLEASFGIVYMLTAAKKPSHGWFHIQVLTLKGFIAGFLL